MATFKELLYRDTTKYICRLTIKNNIIPYTRLKTYNVVDSNKDNHITLYNLIAERCDEISLDDIDTYTISNVNIIENIKTDTSFVNNCKIYYNKCLEKNISDNVLLIILFKSN